MIHQYKKSAGCITAALLMALLLCSCAPLAPTPGNKQIFEAITASNNAQAEPLELAYEEMQVPHRSPGRAHAVIWTPDKSIQRNFIVGYDKKTDTFYVESYMTLVRAEDGCYRKEQE
ncbi:MAG: hypothetical protein PHO66_00130 [Eubacteriales bacterium]|nr:hypothetical protein [Eubacteriales bacterium]